MIWVTVSSWSCFCWLHRASPRSKEYNQSDFAIEHLVMSTCRVFSCVVGRGCLLWSVYSFGKTLLAFDLFCTPSLNLPVTLGISWLPTFAFQSPIMKRISLFAVSSRRTCCFIELFDFSFFGISDWGIDLDYCDVEWFTLQMNQDHSFVFEIAPKYCSLNSCWLGRLLYFF